jgi:hypothetical protein
MNSKIIKTHNARRWDRSTAGPQDRKTARLKNNIQPQSGDKCLQQTGICRKNSYNTQPEVQSTVILSAE